MKRVILSSIVAVAIFTGCTEETKVEEKKVVEAVKVEETKAVKTPEEKLVDQVKDSTTEVTKTIVEESKKVAEIGSEAVKSVSEKVVTATQDVTTEVKEKAVEVKDKIEKSIDTIVAAKSEPQEGNDLIAKGKGLYLKCAGCHGMNAEKPALGKSQVIKGWSQEQIVTALKGYKTDTYGGVMKGVMKSQVANLSDEEIEALGAYISTF